MSERDQARADLQYCLDNPPSLPDPSTLLKEKIETIEKYDALVRQMQKLFNGAPTEGVQSVDDEA